MSAAVKLLRFSSEGECPIARPLYYKCPCRDHVFDFSYLQKIEYLRNLFRNREAFNKSARTHVLVQRSGIVAE